MHTHACRSGVCYLARWCSVAHWQFNGCATRVQQRMHMILVCCTQSRTQSCNVCTKLQRVPLRGGDMREFGSFLEAGGGGGVLLLCIIWTRKLTRCWWDLQHANRCGTPPTPNQPRVSPTTTARPPPRSKASVFHELRRGLRGCFLAWLEGCGWDSTCWPRLRIAPRWGQGASARCNCILGFWG